MLPYGPVGAVRAVVDWLRLSTRELMLAPIVSQSLPGFTVLLRWPPVAVWLAQIACLSAVWIALQRTAREEDSVYEVALVMLLAVLLSPIAWPYSYVLALPADRKSTRLNSSHRCISYAVFCLNKKKIIK